MGLASFRVQILWGEKPDPDDKPQTYAFDTARELECFLMGVEEASGWLGHKLIEPEDPEWDKSGDPPGFTR